MKNEDRIVELLADSLKRQDQQNELLNALVQGQAQLLLTAQETNKRLGAIEKGVEEMSELCREIERIKRPGGEPHIGLD
jgi:hypothetical protein